MSENALMVREEMSLSDTMTLGETMARSGFFDDAREAAQAVVKILAGRELGFGPVASMTGIYIVRKRVCLSANLMAAAVKRDPRYDYKVVKHDAELCSIVFSENGEIVGTSTFTLEDAARAGLSGDNWKKYPRNMLFARAMSNGARWYCPDAFGGGPVYTPEELGATVDESGEIIDVQAQIVEQQKATIDDAAELAEARRESESVEPSPAQERPRRRSWPSSTVDAVMQKKLADNVPNALAMLNKSDVIDPSDSAARVVAWASVYRTQRDKGAGREAAKMAADNVLSKPPEQAEGEGE